MKHLRKAVIRQAARQRSYEVMLAALAEEAATMKLTPDEVSRRNIEIHQSCFGED